MQINNIVPGKPQNFVEDDILSCREAHKVIDENANSGDFA
jgi:hypothetical protein